MCLVACGLLAAAPVEASKIEAVEGKSYGLTERHGPWMIMVKSMWGETASEQDNAREGAKKLVLELRKKGIPAYTYEQGSQVERLTIPNRLNQDVRRVYASQRGMIAVLAGNYPSFEDATAQKTLKWIKKFQPTISIKDKRDGKNAVKEFPLDLSKAFLSRNPMLSAEETAKIVKDPMLLQMNSGGEYSLLENKGRYTLIVASFYGRAHMKPKEFANFDQEIKHDSALAGAALDSWEMCKTMREVNKLDAYVYHEKFRSIVTVGSFDSPNDPRIAQLTQKFQAKYTRNPLNGHEVLVCEAIQIPNRTGRGQPDRNWVMDPIPKVIEVPRTR